MKKTKPDHAGGISPTGYTAFLLLLISLGLALLGGCKEKRPDYCQGYYEGDYIYVAAPVSGCLIDRPAAKGDHVTPGQSLFVLDPNPETIQVRQNEALRDQARDEWTNSLKGMRPHEIEALEAGLAQRQALAEMSGLNAQRLSDVRKDNMVSQNDYDQARYAHEADLQATAQAQANLEQARLGARDDQIQALADQLAAREAALTASQWNLSQKSQTAPAAGLVYDTYYRPGEWVAAGKPVLSLLPPENLKIIFFIREENMTGLQIGQSVYVRDTFHPEPREARVSYISPTPEYTPPLIFSRDTNPKLVFRIEAHPVQADLATMPPGQPIYVYLQKPAGTRL